MSLLLFSCLFITQKELEARQQWSGTSESAADSEDSADSQGSPDDSEDSGPPADLAFVGTVSMDVQGSLSGSDRCEGDLTLLQQGDQISGTFDCIFPQGLHPFQDQAGTISGSASEKKGTLDFHTSFNSSLPWTGLFESDSVTAHFEGEADGGLETLSVSGNFLADRR